VVKAEISVNVSTYGFIFLLILFLELLSYFTFTSYVFEVTTFLEQFTDKIK